MQRRQPPAETVHKYRSKQVNDKLGDEIHGRQHAQPFDADVEIALEDDIKQRQQVVDGRLHDQPVITGHTRGRIRFHKKQTSVRPAEAGRTQSEAEAAALKRTALFRIPPPALREAKRQDASYYTYCAAFVKGLAHTFAFCQHPPHRHWVRRGILHK